MTDDPETTPIPVPDLGSEGLPIRLGCWLVDVGDEVSEGDRLAELVLPGTVVELTSPVSGRLASIERGNGAAVECGTVLGQVAAESDDPERSADASD